MKNQVLLPMFRKIYEFLDDQEKVKFHQLIDYTKVSDNISNDDLKKICKETVENSFYSLCVLPEFVSSAHSFIDGDAKVCAMIDFPKGNSPTSDKVRDIKEAFVNGANEVNVVVNYELIKDEEEHEELEEEIRKISEICHREGKIFKAIIEIGKLTYQDIGKICDMCVEANVDYIMTSTGKLKQDDTLSEKIEKIKHIRKIIPASMQICASGGIRTLDQVEEVKPFCDRVATSVVPS